MSIGITRTPSPCPLYLLPASPAPHQIRSFNYFLIASSSFFVHILHRRDISLIRALIYSWQSCLNRSTSSVSAGIVSCIYSLTWWRWSMCERHFRTIRHGLSDGHWINVTSCAFPLAMTKLRIRPCPVTEATRPWCMISSFRACPFSHARRFALTRLELISLLARIPPAVVVWRPTKPCRPPRLRRG
jgi:hypothetical protein